MRVNKRGSPFSLPRKDGNHSVVAKASGTFPEVAKATGKKNRSGGFSNFVRRLAENKRMKNKCYAVDEMTGQRGVQNSHHMRFAPGYQPLLVPQ